MRFGRQKKSICFLLMICMLFLGMCFENIQTDSSFSCENTTYTVSTISSGERTTLTKQVYYEENLAKEESITDTQQAARRIFNRISRGISLNLAFVDILPQNSPIIYTSSDCELAKESSSNAIIVNYIHHKDGKKA